MILRNLWRWDLDWEIILVIDLGFIGLRVGDGRNFGKGFGGCFDCFKKGG